MQPIKKLKYKYKQSTLSLYVCQVQTILNIENMRRKYDTAYAFLKPKLVFRRSFKFFDWSRRFWLVFRDNIASFNVVFSSVFTNTLQTILCKILVFFWLNSNIVPLKSVFFFCCFFGVENLPYKASFLEYQSNANVVIPNFVHSIANAYTSSV